MLVSAAKDGSILYCKLRLNSVDYTDLSQPKRFVLSYGKPKDPNGHSDTIMAMDISFDGKYLITAGRDMTIKIWNLLSLKYENTLEGHKDTVYVGLLDFRAYLSNSTHTSAVRFLPTRL